MILIHKKSVNIHLRFYEELNDFLPIEKRKKCFLHTVASKTAIKDVIESVGVPHTEIDLILVNHQSVDLTYQIHAGDWVSVYPVFETLDISEMACIRPEPLRKIAFILDVHFGKLAKHLRLLGFDVVYENHFTDAAIVMRSQEEKRIVLTRDVGLLKNKKITHGYWIRNHDPDKQVGEVLRRFDLYQQCKPFTRCLECNGLLESVNKKEVAKHLLPLTFKYHQHFMRCQGCQRVYWQGMHYQKLRCRVHQFLSAR
ncbi:Uncharacterized conserved protein [Legionella lansingensis]|uniref:Twitching motility protein PilT n=2 Tax=Legionella lansingensis TaxID=45067 RepID=A0A0W0VUS9_9GAMM|nr:hypothetical protein Llan_0581 [Legionella lansingensis]SNV47004.1 Uncharacterized conserved protein [Legionella lansingensis]